MALQANDLQEKHIFVHLVDFVQFLHWQILCPRCLLRLSRLGQNLKKCDEPSAIVKCW